LDPKSYHFVIIFAVGHKFVS